MHIKQLAVVAAMMALMASAVFAESINYDQSGWLPVPIPVHDVKNSMVRRRSAESEVSQQESTQGRNLYGVQDEPIYSNDTNIDAVIEHILSSRREGRLLGEFDQVYADGNVEQALEQGDDMQARNLVREKLCVLGLMSCDVEEKRPFYSTISAHQQRPPPHINGGGPYGPPRPMPPPNRYRIQPPTNNRYGSPPPPTSLNAFGPPRKVGYEGPQVSKPFYGRPQVQGPVYNGGPYLETSPPSSSNSDFSFNKPPAGAIIYGSKPPGPVFEGNSDAPYTFEHLVGDKIKVGGPHQNTLYGNQHQSGSSASASHVVGIVANQVQSAAQAAASLQQHVHHHYHHVEGDATAAKAPSVPIPISGGNSLNTDFSTLAQSSAAFAPITAGGFSQSPAYAAGFNGASSQGGLTSNANGGYYGVPQKSNGDSYKPADGFNGAYGQNAGTGFGQSGFGQTSGSYHSSNPHYHKKELHNLGGVPSQNNGLTSGYGAQSQYQGGYENARQQIVDCTCVPFNQCPAADRIGRKDDLILPIDPRNIGKDIEALSDEAAANVTLGTTTNDKTKTEEPSKKAKRETSIQAEGDLSDDTDEQFKEVEGRQRFPVVSLTKRKVLPTFGVSFGLPYPSGSYPVNAINGYPHPGPNPNFGAISPNGLNLGLFNVNPLVSVQVSKTEYGQKVVKPLVNLHVTPNANIIQKVSELFKRKPETLHNKHEHYHHHDHYDLAGFHHGHHHHNHPYPAAPTFAGPDSIHHHPEHSPDPHFEVFSSPPLFEYHAGSAPVPPLHHHEHLGGITGPQYYTEPYEPHYRATGPSSTYSPADNDVFDGYDGSIDPYQRLTNENSSTALHGVFTGNGDYNKAPAYQDYSNNHRQEKQTSFTSNGRLHIPTQAPGASEGSEHITFPKDRRRRSVYENAEQDAEDGEKSVVARSVKLEKRAYYGNRPVPQTCRANEVCCRRPFRPPQQHLGRCGTRNAAGITGRIKNPVYVDGDSEFGEYPWHVAILKKDPKESIYACGGTLIDAQHVITAAHCIKSQNGFDLRARLGEWDVNHDVEFYPYIERDVVSVHIHPEYYAGTLDNDLAVLKLDHPVDFPNNPHISPACLPDKYSDFTGARCWTTGWGKDAFGDQGKYQNILKEADVPILSHQQCEMQLRHTRLGYSYKLNPGFVCAGGEEGKDACKGDGGGPLVCERNGAWNVVGVVSWGIGCGEVNVPGVYVRVAHYLDWIRQITQY